MYHSMIKLGYCIGVSPPPPIKNIRRLFLIKTSLSLKSAVQAPAFQAIPPINWFLVKFFIFHPILFLLYFLLKNCNPLKNVTYLFPSKPPLKTEVLSSRPLFENLVGGSAPSPSRKGRGCTLCPQSYFKFKVYIFYKLRE